MKSTFEIKEQFYLNQKPFKIISGSIHYMRVERWREYFRRSTMDLIRKRNSPFWNSSCRSMDMGKCL